MTAKETIIYQCCFCGISITDTDSAAQILIKTNDGGNQGLMAHKECLFQKLHPSVPFLNDKDE